MVGLPGRGGFPTHRALHPRFDPHHRPVAEQFHTAWVTILRHAPQGTFNPETGQTVFPDPDVIWAGWARIQRQTQLEVTRSIGDRQVVIRGLVVSITANAGQVAVSDEVRVDSFRDPNSGDRHLVGRSLWVHDVYPGSMLWQQDLRVLDHPPTSP